MTSPRSLLKFADLVAKKQLGQHFLADMHIAEAIVAAAGIGPRDTVVEIGAGLGALTIPAARAAGKLYAVELDKRLLDLLSTEIVVSGLRNVELIHRNILRLDVAALCTSPGERLVVLGNLPYNISSQVLVGLIRARDRIDRVVLMFQRELAQRIMAPPGSRTYGRLSAMLAYCARINKVLTVAADRFFPKPKVASEVLRITFFKDPPPRSRQEDLLFAVIKAAFGQRRKTLKNALANSALGIDGTIIHQVLKSADIDPRRRAETLSAAEFQAIGRELEPLVTPPDVQKS